MSRTNIENIYPLSPMQQGMLFDTLYATESGIYFVQIAWTLRGGLDAAAFVRAFQEAVDRHPVLRTGFAWERLERPVQIVRKRAVLPVHEEDLRGLDPAAQGARIEQYAAADRKKGFDLQKPPLMRLALFRLTDDTYRSLWSRHHLLLDGWSTPLLVKEIFALYAAFSKGEEPRLPRPRPFGDYISWLAKQDPAKETAFWKARLAGFTAPTALRVDRAPTGELGHDDRKLTLSEDVSARLAAFARQRQITLSTLLQGAWALLLSRYSGEPDVLFGATVSGRSAPVPGIDGMIGMFINTLPVRVSVPPEATAGGWLDALHRDLLALRDHEHSPLVEVQAASDVPRGTPLFETLVVFENYPVEEALRQSGAGLNVADSRTIEKSSVPLTLLAVYRNALTLSVSYDARRFAASSMERLLAHVGVLLEGLVAEPDRQLADVPILPTEERRRIIDDFNATDDAYPEDAALHEIFEAQVDRTPDALALVHQRTRLTYAELDARANRLAHLLQKRGVGPEVLVGICMPRTADIVVAILGVLKAGGAYVPIDPAYPADRIAFTLQDAKAPILVTERSLLDVLPAVEGTQIIALDAEQEALAAEPASRLAGGAKGHDLAYVLFTSGSTGRPKGVAIEHHSPVALVCWARTHYGPEDWCGTLFSTSVCFDLSIFEMFVPLSFGGAVIVAQNALELPSIPAASEVTLINTVPSAMAELLRMGAVPPSVRTVNLAGEPLPHALAREIYAVPTIARLLNLYGPTEDTTYSTWAEGVRESGLAPPIGRVLTNGIGYVLDPRKNPAPIGVPGELYLGGAGLARGYLYRPDLTAERFVENPFTARHGGRLYRTGDLVRCVGDGSFEYLGRIDHQVKVRGFRIELGEIEAVLSALPALRDVVAIVREDSPGDRRIVAYLVAEADHAVPTVAELRAALKEKLPEFMVPSAFVPLDKLPMTPNGKVDRKALPAPEGVATQGREFVAPRGPVEEAVASIFAEVLKLAPGDVSARDTFFELGGHSLLATQAISRVRAALGVDLQIRALFDTPTVTELAAHIEASLCASRPVADAPLTRIPRGVTVPLSFGQERLWFLAQLDPGDTAYNIPFAVRFSGAVAPAALERTLGEIVRRHEVLRTTFASDAGRPVGVVHADLPVSLPITDLSATLADGREPALRQATAAEAGTPFDLATGPLLRARLLRFGPEDSVLLLTLHHIVSDVWTRAVLNREISSLYDAFSQGRPSPLAELPVQYADFAAWQRQVLSGERLEAELSYWRDQLGTAPRLLELPTDRPRPPVRSSRGERVPVGLSPELTRALRDLCRREGVTLYMLLLAALDILLHRYTGQRDIVVGSPIAGRSRPEIEGLVGFFLNTLVLRAEVDGDLVVKEHLQRVKATALGAYAHQDLPFERLVQELDPERDLSRSPIFQVIFNLQNTPRAALSLSGVAAQSVQIDVASTKTDLALILAEGPASVQGSLYFSTDLFDRPTVERMVGHFRALLEALPKGADKRVRELPMLAEAERHQLLVDLNDTRLAMPHGETLVDMFDAVVGVMPDALAVVAGPDRLSFRDLDARANRLAHRLQRLGVGPDTVVGLCQERTANMVIGILGILKAGGAYVPLEPSLPRARLAQILDDARSPVLVTTARLVDVVPHDGVELIRLDADAASLAEEPSHRPECDAESHHLAYVLFTSGSTGKPKGVAIEHRNIVNYVRGIDARLRLPRDAGYAHVSTFSADVGNTSLFPPLCLGGTLHVISEDLVTDPLGLAAYMNSERVDLLKLVPSHLSALLTGTHAADILPRAVVVVGGEGLTWDLVARIEALAPHLRILNHYSPTECTVGVLTYPVQPGDRPPTPIAPLGRPLPNSRVYVLDAAMEPTPVGVPGEIYIGGAGVSRGYLGQPEMTKERFVPDPFSAEPGARLYRSGDRARVLPSGDIQFMGRVDFQVKIRGFRVELGEIEAALIRSPAVKDAVVLAQDDGYGSKRLAAYVVLRGAGAASEAELAAWVGARLPEYMVPAGILILDKLPLTPNGKIDRKALPALSDGHERGGDVAPRTPVEEVIHGIWCAVFEREAISVDTRFADLGGHSLLAIQIVARAREAFQIELPLRAIFEHPTIAALSEQVEQAVREGHGVLLPPVTPAPRGEPLPLSFAQERLWFLNQLEPESPFYNVSLNMRFRGPFSPAALERALREVIRRHEVLRSSFPTVDGKAVQVVHPPPAFHLPVRLIAGDTPEERGRTLAVEAAAEVQRPFDLAVGPLVRARLLELAPDDHALLMTTHHIVSDAWTRAIIFRELMACYDAYSTGGEPALSDLPVQYGDYAVWQRTYLEGEVYERQMAYWREQLSGAPPALELPTDRPRPPVQSYRGAWRALSLPGTASAALKELSRREGATFFMTLLAAFDVLLQRYTGQDDIVLGTPAAGRGSPEIEGLVGFFINTLVLRTTLSDNLTFADLLGRVRETCLGAYAHQDMSFERLVQELSPVRDLSRAPLFQVLFTFQNPPREARAGGGLTVGGVSSENPTSKYDMTVAISEQVRGLVIAVEYATDLFDRSTIDRLLLHYRAVLDAIVADPRIPLSDIRLLSAEEESMLVHGWNQTDAPLPEVTAHQLVEAQAARTPDALAIVFGDQQLTYRQLDERANQLARHLRTLGVRPGTLVGVSLPRSLSLPVALLGVLKAGAAYVPVDPSYPPDRIAFMLSDSAVPILVTEERFAAAVSAKARLVFLDAHAPAIAAESAAAPEQLATPGDLAYVIYTSGSTGKPKGTLIHHRALVNYLLWCVTTYDAASGRGAPVHSSASFDLTVTGLYTPLCVGKTVFMMPEEGEIEALVRLLSEEGGLSFVKLTPAHLEVLTQLVPADRARGATRALVMGGESLTWEMLAFWQEHAPETRLINEYGPTETTVGSNLYEARPGLGLSGVVTIGRPIANTRLYVLDKRLRPAPIGVRGELYIGGVQVARGYLNRPELTAERFLPSPFVPGDRLYKSGDMACIRENGEIEFLGRADDQVKIRGFRIELGEIEAVLATHPGLGETVVLAREDSPGDRRLVAYFVGAVEPAHLRDFLAARLPDYMVPTAWVRLDSMPLTPNGKADRKALPAPEARGIEGVIAAPRNPVEEVVAGIWAEVLRLPEISIHDSFFEVGGHSLIATQVISRIAAALSVDLPLQAIFEAPTVAGLAAKVSEALARGQGLSAPPLTRVPRDGDLPLSFGQERLWFLEQLSPGGTIFVVPQAVRMDGALDVGALQRALAEIVRRHEALRTTFGEREGRPLQVIHEAADLELPVLDLSDLDPSAREAAARREAAREAATPFDLGKGPLLRPRLVRLAAEQHLLLLTMHHIVSDAWTQGVFNNELCVLYTAFAEGRPSPLGDLPIQYADFAAWQRRWLSGEVLERQLGYWRGRLAGAPRALDLPADRPRPPVQSQRGGRRAATIPADVAVALAAHAQREGATLFMTLLAAFDILLHRYTGQCDLVVGTPIAGRSRAETEQLVGFFVNTLALRAEVDGAMSFRALLARVKESCLGAYAHQDMPFERLVQDLAPERDLSRQPLYQVTFALHNAPREALRLPGITLRGMGSDVATAKYDLQLVMVESPGGLTATMAYASDLFEGGTIERMLAHLGNLLAAIAADPDAPVGDLAMLSAEERATIVGNFNETAAPYTDRPAHELFAAQAARTPDAAALIHAAGSLTFRELEVRANRLAQHLVALGVREESLVGVALARSPDVVITILAVMKAGGAYVPLDPAYPADRLSFMMEDARLALVVTISPILGRLPAPPAPVLCLDLAVADIEAASAASPSGSSRSSSAAYVIYTSGTTGRPKGVVVEHGGLGNLAAAQAKGFRVGPESRVLQFASTNFDASVSEILVTLLAGAALVMAAPEEMLPGPDLQRTLVERAISVVTLPPSALAAMPDAALPALRTLVVAGEACPEDIVDRWAPGRRFVNAYGPTEATVCATMEVCTAGEGRPTIGRPIDNVRVHLLDGCGQPVPVGVPGELHIGGAGLARGYLNRPELTAERFIASRLPEARGERLYRSGDLARYRPDGRIEFLGRVDQQVKVRGYRVEPGEIEAVLAEQPGVREAVVIARGDRLVGYVVSAGESALLAADMKRALRLQLPEYMVPSAIVALAALPLSPNGKVDRRALPAPDVASLGAEAEAPEARGPIEEAIADAFAEVLRVPRSVVRGSFFDLGGHSLLATQVVSRIRGSFGVDLPLRALFEAPTPAALAALVEDRLREGVTAPPPLARVPRGAPLPLSFGQERLWLLAQLDPRDVAYNVPVALRLAGPLDHAALTLALHDLILRHEALRTSFSTVGGQPAQIIRGDARLDLPLIHLDALPASDREAALRREIAAEAARPFDLEAAPPVRARLFALAPEDHALVLTMHHIVTDGWSMGVLDREISALYQAHRAGEPAALPALPVQYADFAAWQRGWLSGAILDGQLAYWRAALAGAPASLDLPTDRPRPPVMTSHGGRRAVVLPVALLQALAELSRREGATLFMTLLAAFDVLLHRYTGQSDVVVGSPIAGRGRAETEGLIGFFVNTLVLRASINPEQSFREHLARVRAACLGAYAHQDIPFERLVQELAPERDQSRTPLYQVSFALQNAPRAALRLGGVELARMSSDFVTAKFDLALTMSETPAGLVTSMVYNADLFDDATVERMLAQLRVLLAGIVADPAAPLRALPILPDEERRRLLSFAGERTEYPRDATIHALFEAEAARRPEALAVVFGAERLTYAELDRRANRLARRLLAEGVTVEEPVGLYARRSADMIVATLAVLKAGAAYVPLDPDLPAARLAWTIADAGIRLVIACDAALAPDAVAGVSVLSLAAEGARIAAESEAALPRLGSSTALAYIMYTSGSTGTPKGVCVVHRGVVRLVKNTNFAKFGEDEVFLQLAPISFDAATLEIWGPLLNGGRLAVAPAEPPSLAQIGELIRAHGVTTMWLTAGLFNAMIEAHPEGLRPLRRLLAGGEALSVPHVQRALAELPGVALINGYGPTEGTTFTTCHAIASADGPSIPIGRPIANTTVHILDDRGEPAPIGVAGELFVGGDGLARGYLARPELSAERFVETPFGRLYKTGDRARWLADGTIAFLGRLDLQVKLRGFRIELGEIESLLGQHPGVAVCTAQVREDAPGDRRLVAYVVPGGAPLSGADLEAWLASRLPRHMLPSAFVSLDALPLTPNGKVDRRALPAPEGPSAASEYVAPRGPIEEAVAAVFAEVLRVPAVGARDGFFALGGHSLLAAQVISRLRAALGVEIPLRALFDADNPAALARRVEEALRGPRADARPIARVARGVPHALSFAEERIWFLAQLAPEDPSYVVPLSIRLGGAVDRAVLAAVLGELTRRHEVLRTTYGAEDELPFAVVHEPAPVPLPVTAWPDLAREDRVAALRHAIAEEVRRPFDLLTGPLLRARLFALDEHEHLLLLTMHHIVCDAWAVALIRREIAVLYGAFAASRPSPLADPAVQVVDFAAWQRAVISGDALASELAYWKDQLAGAPTSVDLPTDRPRPPIASHAGELRTFTLRPGLHEALVDLSRREGTTLFMTLLAAFQLLLHRFTGQLDLVVGTPIVGRSRAEIEGTVGIFLNMLVLRTRLADDLTFRGLLARVRETCLGAYAHQDVPFERLVQELSPARDLSRAPLFQVLFTLQNAPRDPDRKAGFSLREEVEQGSAKFDLSLAFGDGPRGFGGTFEYATDLFDRATIERMASHLVTALEGVVAAPDHRLREIPILPDAERRLVVETWNATGASYAREATIHRVFSDQAARSPDVVAVSCEGRGALTYAELDGRSNRLARLLAARGVTTGALVGIAVERSSAMVVALLAILKSGAAYVPLDPTYPKDRLAFMAEDAGLALLVTESALQGVVPQPAGGCVLLDADQALVDAHSDAPLELPTDPVSLAYVIYTSGSTGKPKGVEIPHRAVLNFLASMAREPGLAASDRLLAVTSLSFDIAGLELWLPLATGAHVEIATRETASDGAALARRLVEGHITVVQATPSTFRLLLDAGWPGDGALRILVGGEAVPRDLVDRLAERAGSVWNMYGPTETTIWSCVQRLEKDRPVLIGRPIANTQALVLDAAGGPAPIGVPGELYLGGDGLARGYLKRPELTAERFVETPFGRLYKTGDLVRWTASGALEFLGRLDFQVKIRGYRIELGEIEAVLAQHSAVRDAVVTAREDVPGDKRLVAYVTPAPGAQPTSAALRAHVKDALPDHMVPSVFVVIERLPLTANNKIDRKALPAPDLSASEACAHVEPRGPVEEAIAAIFAEVLRAPRVSATDGFFELGGHSLLATAAVARIRVAFEVELPLRAIFEAPTAAALAARVEAALREGRGAELPPLEPIPRAAETALSYGQERLWFLDRLEPGDTSYVVPLALRFAGSLDLGAMERALTEIVSRHEILRTTYALSAGQPVARVVSPSPVSLQVRRWPDLPHAERQGAMRRALAEEVRRPLDLGVAPLRFAFFEIGDEDHVLLIALHHIASDAWSLGVLRRELAALYAAFREGLPSPLPELSIQYADYAAWQRRWLSGETLEHQLAYWRAHLGGAPSALDLPTDRPRPKVASHRGGRCMLALSPALTAGIEALSRRAGVTLFMTLLAAFDVVLHRWSRQDDIVVGTPVAGRARPETEPLVGFFINTLPIRARVDGDEPFTALLARIKEASLGAFAHQDVPFERLVSELDPARDLARSPIFQVMFALQNMPSEARPLQGVSQRSEIADSGTAKFDLTLTLVQGREGLHGPLDYAADLFDSATIDRLAGHLTRLLEGVVATPHRPLRELPLLSDAERRLLVDTWNETAAIYDRSVTLHGLVSAQAARTPNAVAASFEGRDAITFDAIDRRSNRLARVLRARGVRPGALVGVAVERSTDMIVALLGILKAGAAYVPLDPTYPRERLAFMAADAELALLVTETKLEGLVPAPGGGAVLLDANRALIDAEADAPLDVVADPESLAYVIYTSGSTGRPKGVQIPHRAVVNFLASMARAPGLAASDRLLAVTSLSFDIAGLEIWLPLATGAYVEVASRDTASDGVALARRLAEGAITVLQATPTTFRLLLDSGWKGSAGLRVLVGGEAVPKDLVDRLVDRVAAVWNMYGPTETTIWSCIQRLARAEPILIGRPIANTQAYVFDASGEPAPIGVPGELYLGGDGMARGYLRRPELTAERFVSTPLGRLYRTGDLARVRDGGAIEFLGRLDFQVKVRGYRIELGEIEAALAQHADVGEAVVAARDEGGDKRLVAYFTAAPGATPSAGALRAHLRDTLPEHMIPSAFVVLDRMPLTANNKIDRKALPAPLASAAEPEEIIEPRGPVEATIATIFADVLGLARVGVTQDFFALGGHSLLGTRAMALLTEALGVELPLRALFEVKTVAGLAELVDFVQKSRIATEPEGTADLEEGEL